MSDTIARLAALKAQYAPPLPGQDVTPNHLQSLNEFGSHHGQLRARYHVPDDLPEGAPLVVVLHGCTQNAASYDHHAGWSRLADEEGFAVLFPEQQRANNPNLCFNWFQPGDARRGSGEALSIREMIEIMVVANHLDRKRLFITGLSAGGAMAAAMLATYPEVFAGGAIIAGLPYGSATTIPEAFDRMRGHGVPSDRDLQRSLRAASDHRGPWPRISIWHGSADATVAPSNAEAIAGQWRAIHAVGKLPTRSETAGRLTRSVWSDAAGRAVIEINMVIGMGHGTPIGGDGLGAPGAYMLDVGISSTREIARFWGIAAAAAESAFAEAKPSPQGGKSGAPSRMPDLGTANTGKGVMPGTRHVASGPKKIIEDALRSAGLMR